MGVNWYSIIHDATTAVMITLVTSLNAFPDEIVFHHSFVPDRQGIAVLIGGAVTDEKRAVSQTWPLQKLHRFQVRNVAKRPPKRRALAVLEA